MPGSENASKYDIAGASAGNGVILKTAATPGAYPVPAVAGTDYADPAAVALKADDSNTVHKTGAETIAGAKTFTSSMIVQGSLTVGPSGTFQFVDQGAGNFRLTGDRIFAIDSESVWIRNNAGTVKMATFESIANTVSFLPAGGNVGLSGTLNPLQPASIVGTLGFQGTTSTTADQPQGRITPAWADATHASRKGRMSIFASDFTGTDQEGIRVESDGTQALIGFFGGTAVAKQAAIPNTSGATLANLELEVNKLKQLIRNFNLMS